jgi:hypothetical protein
MKTAQKVKTETVMGHRIPRPRLALGAAWVAFVYAVGPVLAIGAGLDLAAQHWFGVCTGLWCAAP